MLVTSTVVKQRFRHYLTKYLDTPEPHNTIYLYNIVAMLLPYKECNTLEKTLGKERYEKLIASIHEFHNVYYMSAHTRDYIEKLREKKSENANELARMFEKRIKAISQQLPLLKPALFYAFDQLVNNSDLRNVAIVSSRPKYSGEYGIERA